MPSPSLCRRPPAAPTSADRDAQGRVCAEYSEMPGLNLTLEQAARLFDLERDQCERVLDSLVDEGVLATDGPAFVRADTERRHVGHG